MNILFGSGLKLPRKKKFFFFAVFVLVHPPMASLLLSASVERCFVSRMRDFFTSLWFAHIRSGKRKQLLKETMVTIAYSNWNGYYVYWTHYPKSGSHKSTVCSKWAAHKMPRKILLVQNQAPREHFYEWLLCNYCNLGSSLLKGWSRGYHVFLPPIVCQKWKPQIDGLFINELHIYGLEKVYLS